jgi:carbon-monoxide dehydrogenase medium subunit
MKAPLAKEILEPATVAEAVDLLKEKSNSACLIAGGTDLLPWLKDGVLAPDCLIDIAGLPLNYIKGSPAKGFKIGAATTMKEIRISGPIKRGLPVLAAAAAQVGGSQTQELATIGGNLCTASPAGNLVTVLLALEAEVKLLGPDGERVVPLREFFRGPKETVIEDSEIMTEVVIPPLPRRYGADYIKFTLRREMDIALVGVAVMIVPEGTKVGKIRIALGAVGPVAFLAQAAQKILEGNKYSAKTVEEAVKAAVDRCSFISDVRANAQYRREVTAVLLRRAIASAWTAAKGGK